MAKAKIETEDDKLPPEVRRELKRVHRRMKQHAEAGGVIPTPEIVNRRTGYVQQFGRRRAFDGAYVGEVLAASGCWTEDLENALWVLAPLADHNCGDWTVKDLLRALPPVFHEQWTRAQLNQLRKAGEGASGTIINGQLTITPGKPRLRVVE
jgi:hypothetical protein